MGFGVGVYDFFKGFQVYREYRIIEDTPRTPIRSIAMGLYAFAAEPAAAKLYSARSPARLAFLQSGYREVGGRPERSAWLETRQNRRRWNQVLFYLEDSTGKLLVDVHGAEYT
jgi:hypothetical protein